MRKSEELHNSREKALRNTNSALSESRDRLVEDQSKFQLEIDSLKETILSMKQTCAFRLSILLCLTFCISYGCL
jgi:hypothetical protein